MNINEYATTPKLLKLVLDSAELIEAYGEPIIFWTYDIVSLSTYFDFFNARNNSEFDSLNKIIKKMILLEDGSPAIKEGQDLPIDIVAAALSKIGEILGKSHSKPSTQLTGDPLK